MKETWDKYKISEKDRATITNRDRKCVYCGAYGDNEDGVKKTLDKVMENKNLNPVEANEMLLTRLMMINPTHLMIARPDQLFCMLSQEDELSTDYSIKLIEIMAGDY
jgi:hypothetical protein